MFRGTMPLATFDDATAFFGREGFVGRRLGVRTEFILHEDDCLALRAVNLGCLLRIREESMAVLRRSAT